MRRRYVLLGLVLVAGFAVAMPAVGASPAKLARKALRTAKRADKRAKLALSQIKSGVPKADNATNAQNATNATHAHRADSAAKVDDLKTVGSFKKIAATDGATDAAARYAAP